MAITDPEAVRFSNEKARTLADAATRYYWAAKAFVNEWDATGMAAKIPNTADVVADDGMLRDAGEVAS